MSGARHLYVHLPFCASRCGYCAFVVEVGSLERRDAYTTALLTELALQSGQMAAEITTVYFGGGTPTLMAPAQIGRILETLGSRLADDVEISIEANPETVDRTTLSQFRRLGVNRVSLGVQSSRRDLLRALDRAATPEQCELAVAHVRDAGFTNLSVDLLFGVPGQDAEDLEADIALLERLSPDHVSWYELEVKAETKLATDEVTVDEDFAEYAYHQVVQSLEQRGYRWYETANFARPGFECRHNLGYWGAADYLGIGIGAVSTIDGSRWRNAPHLERYIAALAAGTLPRRSIEHLDPATRRRERWMLGLRLDGPLDMAWAGEPDNPHQIGELQSAGLLKVAGGAVQLTRRGRFLQNAVLGKLMEYD